jgi:hypothetical protein
MSAELSVVFLEPPQLSSRWLCSTCRLGAIGVVETAYDEQEAKDKKIIANLQAALKD